MKNKMSISTFAILTILSGCGSKTGMVQTTPKPEISIADKLAKLPNDTVFEADLGDVGLENENGKWKYTVKDGTNKKFVFDVKEMKENGIFYETEFQKMNFGAEMDTKLKIVRNNELSYAQYGFLEILKPDNGKQVNLYNSFVMYQKDKEVPFIKPEQETTFSGSTYAMLTKRKNGKYSYDTLTGTAKMTVGAGQSISDIEMKYNNWKTLTVKNVNLENGNFGEWKINDSNMGFFTDNDNKPELSITNLENKEIVGSYRARLYENPITPTNKASYTLDGVFGMKKQ